MLSIFKSAKQGAAHIESLYDAIVEKARQPFFYTEGEVPDTAEGRFEVIALHVILAIRQLNSEGEAGKDAGQALFEHFFKDMDSALREMGIGDTSIGKKVRAMAEVFYGRFKAYAKASDAGDADQLAEAISRNVFETETAPSASRFATYYLNSMETLSGQKLLDNGAAQQLRYANF
ncbi:ubiquinol-cytochrome C chaperone family protein [Hyphobacterium sp.]|uniref:ubiquinol-cytochrome C chaperone family protein n=1 Tax=Hyphobacterium sp. TaxID=2004662 RepID=UPI003BA9BC45